MQFQLLAHLLRRALDTEREERARQAAPVAEDGNAFALQALAADVREQAAEAAVHACAVHVAAHGRDFDRRLHAGCEALLGESHERLLDRLIRQRGRVVNLLHVRWDIGEERIGRIGEIVVVEKAGVRLGHQLAGGGVEAYMIESVKRSLDGGVSGRFLDISVRNGTVGLGLVPRGFLTCVVRLVARVDGLGITLDGKLPVNHGIFARQVRLVKIVSVLDVGGSQTRLEDQRSIGSDEHRHAASTTGRPGVALFVERDVARDDNGIPAVPSRGLHPVNGIEDCVRSAVASIDGVDAFDVGVATLFEQLHQNGLDRLGLVENGLRSHFQPSNGTRIDLVLAEQ